MGIPCKFCLDVNEGVFFLRFNNVLSCSLKQEKTIFKIPHCLKNEVILSYLSAQEKNTEKNNVLV